MTRLFLEVDYDNQLVPLVGLEPTTYQASSFELLPATLLPLSKAGIGPAQDGTLVSLPTEL